MTDKFSLVMQRPRLLALASTLEISLTQLRREDFGDWAIIGRFGNVYALACSYRIVITGRATSGWNRCKRDLAFATLILDGGNEGVFILDRDPTPGEAATIRKRVGLRKRREISEEALAALRDRGKALSAFHAKKDAQKA